MSVSADITHRKPGLLSVDHSTGTAPGSPADVPADVRLRRKKIACAWKGTNYSKMGHDIVQLHGVWQHAFGKCRSRV